MVGGCSAIPVRMHTESHVRHADGTVEHKSSDWEGTLDQLPAQIAKAGSELEEVTAKVVKEITAIPPPGKVVLSDLSPGLARYQGQPGVDFVVDAKDEKGEPIDFSYVKLGVPSYDEFFKTSMELYALVQQTTQTIGQLRKTSTKLNANANGELKAQVDQALAKNDPGEGPRLRMLADTGASLAELVPQIAGKIEKLIATGQALVAGAASSLTNPKVVTHLGLVKKALFRSIAVIKESGVLLVGFGKDLAGFGKA